MSCWPRAGSRPPQARTMRRACAAPRPRLWTRPAGCSTRCDRVNWGTRPAAKCTPTPAVLGTAARHSFALAGCSRDRTAMTNPDWPDGPRDGVGYDAGPPPEGPLGVGYGSLPQPDDPRHNVGYDAGPPPDGPRDDAGYGAGPPPDGPRDDAGYGVVPQPDGPADPAPVTSTPSTSGGHRRPRRGRGAAGSHSWRGDLGPVAETSAAATDRARAGRPDHKLRGVSLVGAGDRAVAGQVPDPALGQGDQLGPGHRHQLPQHRPRSRHRLPVPRRGGP